MLTFRWWRGLCNYVSNSAPLPRRTTGLAGPALCRYLEHEEENPQDGVVDKILCNWQNTDFTGGIFEILKYLSLYKVGLDLDIPGQSFALFLRNLLDNRMKS